MTDDGCCGVFDAPRKAQQRHEFDMHREVFDSHRKVQCLSDVVRPSCSTVYRRHRGVFERYTSCSTVYSRLREAIDGSHVRQHSGVECSTT